MSRIFTIKELNEKIDELIKGVEDERQKNENQHPKRFFSKLYYAGKIESLEELKLELNSPEPLINVTNKIQESLNIIETNKIIKDGL